MAVVLRMSEVETTAHKILEMALPTAQEESLRSRINLNLAGIIGHSNSRRAHVILEQVYNSNAGTCLQVTAMRYLGNTLVADGDMEAADNALSDALALSDIFGKEQESAKVINDIGWMLIKQKRYNRAESLFLKLLRKRLRPYIRVMAIQNLAYLHFQQEHYNKAVYHHIQSLKLCSRQGMTGMMYEDYYKLGLCSELLGHPGEALRYYEAGFTYLKHEIEMGLPLIGYRRKLVSSYNDFLGRLGHSKQFMFS